MSHAETEKLVQQLAAGFETLQDEYRKLFSQHQSLETKLATAREQYNKLAKLCNSGTGTTPPLSLVSASDQHKAADEALSVADILERQHEHTSREAAKIIRDAIPAGRTLRDGLPRSAGAGTSGVTIWSGPLADRPQLAGSSLMPSISESPLEQDFTVEGKPSQLGCPFASMAGKKLSSHAASVLSRYNTRDSAGEGGAASTAMSSVSRVNGKDSLSRRESRRASFEDPIKAEICGLSDRQQHDDVSSMPQAERRATTHEPVITVENAESGVCPIRFLDQHSPEEVATYFEKHKHELPRSHEVCVRRYQSNESQIRELDEKYGNLVSMIQGLGKKHKDYLPLDPEPDQEGDETAMEDGRSNEKVRRWASNVSVQAAKGDVIAEEDEVLPIDEDERQPHFARPLRDIRVGESPSRPWGIPVPVKYLEKHAGEHNTEVSSQPAEVSAPLSPSPQAAGNDGGKGPVVAAAASVARCPFGFDRKVDAPSQPTVLEVPVEQAHVSSKQPPAPVAHPAVSPSVTKHAAFIMPAAESDAAVPDNASKEQPKMIFTGPVFIGYSAEDAAKILRDSGWGGQH